MLSPTRKAKLKKKLFIVQKGCCVLCRVAHKSPDDMALDHDHLTGYVRALLCYQCNNGLGQFLDNPALLRCAIAYLNKHGRFDRKVRGARRRRSLAPLMGNPKWDARLLEKTSTRLVKESGNSEFEL